jgi:hypothetical protein
MRSWVKAEFVLPSGLRHSHHEVSETFEAWRGPAIAHTYGNKPVLDWHGEPLFAELVVLRQWQARGWDGAWVDRLGSRLPGCRPTSVIGGKADMARTCQ